MIALKVIGIILLILVLLIGVVPLFAPLPPLKDTQPLSQLVDPDSKFLEVTPGAGGDGVGIHYKVFGQGQPVMILLHGFGASTFSWREVTGPLAKLGTVVVYDRPAFGLTERPLPGQWSGESPYSANAQVEQLAGLMDQLSIQRAILIGNSAGGGVAANFYMKYPQRVQGIVFVDPAINTGGSGGGGMYSRYRFLFNLPQMRWFGPILVRSISKTGMDILIQAWHDPNKITPEINAGYRKPLQAANWDIGLWELTRASSSVVEPVQLGDIKLPVLVVTGDDDRIVPTQSTIRLAGELPNARLVVIPNCGHVPHEECPQPFLDAVVPYINQVK